MDLFFVRDCLARAAERKKTLILSALLFLTTAILGMCFISEPAVYDYHLVLCDKFVSEVCYSDVNVFVIFLSRIAGHALLLLLVMAGGVHPAALILSAAVLFYRAFTFGGSIFVFFSYYGFTGAVMVFVLYLPVHLCIDAVLLLAFSVSCGRAFACSCTKEGIFAIFMDFLALLLLVAAVCLAEALLLLILFHPIGNIL